MTCVYSFHDPHWIDLTNKITINLSEKVLARLSMLLLFFLTFVLAALLSTQPCQGRGVRFNTEKNQVKKYAPTSAPAQSSTISDPVLNLQKKPKKSSFKEEDIWPRAQEEDIYRDVPKSYFSSTYQTLDEILAEKTDEEDSLNIDLTKKKKKKKSPALHESKVIQGFVETPEMPAHPPLPSSIQSQQHVTEAQPKIHTPPQKSPQGSVISNLRTAFEQQPSAQGPSRARRTYAIRSRNLGLPNSAAVPANTASVSKQPPPVLKKTTFAPISAGLNTSKTQARTQDSWAKDSVHEKQEASDAGRTVRPLQTERKLPPLSSQSNRAVAPTSTNSRKFPDLPKTAGAVNPQIIQQASSQVSRPIAPHSSNLRKLPELPKTAGTVNPQILQQASSQVNLPVVPNSYTSRKLPELPKTAGTANPGNLQEAAVPRPSFQPPSAAVPPTEQQPVTKNENATFVKSLEKVERLRDGSTITLRTEIFSVPGEKYRVVESRHRKWPGGRDMVEDPFVKIINKHEFRLAYS